jgi:hypothetical protein
MRWPAAEGDEVAFHSSEFAGGPFKRLNHMD